MIREKYIQLTTREASILKLTVEEYIVTNRSIGSDYLKKRYHLDISSATVRNDLAKLESMGLIKQPFTSSGRIPTDLGYRFYVDNLMEESPIQSESVMQWSSTLSQMSTNVEELMQATATMMAKASRLFGVVLVSEVQQGILKDIECIPLSSDRIMVVLAMESGIIRSMVFNLEISIEPNEVYIINQILNEYLTGYSLKEIQTTVRQRLIDTPIYNHEIVQVLLRKPKENFALSANNLIYKSTNQFLFTQDEFQQIGTMQTFMKAVEKQNIKQMLISPALHQKNDIFIGEEIDNSTFKQFSVLTTKFQIEYLVGKLAILGPTRIPYKNIKTILKHFSEIITHVC